MRTARVYVFDATEVKDGWPTQYVSMEDYDSLRWSHESLSQQLARERLRNHALFKRLTTLRAALRPAVHALSVEDEWLKSPHKVDGV